MADVATAVKKLDVSIGDVVEVEGRRYDVVSDKDGGVSLEPATTMTQAERHERDGTRRATQEEFDRYFGDLPSVGEG